jgi:mannosyltransferase
MPSQLRAAGPKLMESKDVLGAQGRSGLVRFLPVSMPELAGLISILGIAGFLRFFHLDPGLNDDETYSLNVARHSLGSILRILEQTDTHPPLSYFLLHFWMQAFGSSEVAVRSLAALFGVGTVLMLYLLGRLLWGPLAGLIAALLLSLSEFNVQYSHNARMYTLMTFLAAASFYFFARLRIAPSRAVVVPYLLSSAALIYTHVWGVFLVAAQTVVVVLLLATEPAHRASMLLRWLSLQACLLVLWSPWLVLGLRRQIETTLHDNGTAFGNLSLIPRPTAHDVLKAPYYAANTYTLAALFVVVVCVAIASHLVGVARRDQHSAASTMEGLAKAVRRAATDAGGDPRLALITAWLVVPLLMAVALSYLVTPILLPRYVIALSLPVYLVVAAALTHLWSKTIAVVALFAIVIAAGLNVVTYTSSLSDFYRAPVKYVATRAAPGDLVLYDMDSSVFHHYAERADLEGTYIRAHQDDRATIKLLAGHRDAITPQIRDPFAPATVATDLQALFAAARKKRVWLLMGPQFPGQLPESTATSRLRAAFGPPQLMTRVGEFDVFLFERRYD